MLSVAPGRRIWLCTQPTDTFDLHPDPVADMEAGLLHPLTLYAQIRHHGRCTVTVTPGSIAQRAGQGQAAFLHRRLLQNPVKTLRKFFSAATGVLKGVAVI